MPPGGAEQIDEPGMVLGIRQFSRLELDQTTQKKAQHTAEGVHADLPIGPLMLRAHCHVLVPLQLRERFSDLTLTATDVSVAQHEQLSDEHRSQRT